MYALCKLVAIVCGIIAIIAVPLGLIVGGIALFATLLGL